MSGYARRLLLEAERRRETEEKIDFAELAFGPQRKFIEDPAQFVAGCTGRQAGKTDGVALKLMRVAALIPRCLVLYITLSRPSAKRIMWPKLHEWNRRLDLGMKSNGTDLTMTLRNGSVILLGGANDEAEVERYRGVTVPLIAIDEAQAFRGFLGPMIRDILIPATWRYRGQIVMTGTPNASGLGYFAQATNGEHDRYLRTDDREPMWSTHHWTGLDNPYLENIDARWAEERKLLGLDLDSASYQREYLGRWVRDDESLVYRIPDHSLVQEMPEGEWEYHLGVDVGHVDETAFVVLAVDRRQRLMAVCESYTISEAIPQTIMVEVDRLAARYPFVAQVMDPGGGGKFVIEEYNRLHGGQLRVAEKRAKQANIEMLNGALRAGRVLVVAPRNEGLLEEARMLQWDWGRTARGAELMVQGRLRIDDSTSDHLLDAFLYAYRSASGPAGFDEHENPTPGTEEWFRAEEERLFQQALDRVQSQEERSDADDLLDGYDPVPWA